MGKNIGKYMRKGKGNDGKRKGKGNDRKRKERETGNKQEMRDKMERFFLNLK